MSESIFLDASFWIALRNSRDERAELARRIMLKLNQARPMLVTTLLVAAETHAYVSRNQKMRAQVLSDLQSAAVFRLETIRSEDESAAIAYLRARADKSYSLCDAVSFTLMRRLGMSRVLTFDDHFSQMGCQIIDNAEVV